MIQSLHRALDILEFISQRPDQPTPLGQIADSLSLNASTCANLIKTLVTRGYVEQVGARQGYVLGPMAHYLVRQGPYRRDIVAAAEPLLAELARNLQENLVLARLHQDRLFMLTEAEGDQVLQVRRDLLLVDDAYRTANGRLLLAYLDDAQLAAFLGQRGLPGEVWPEAGDETGLRRHLATIRAAGQYVDVSERQVARASFPIWQHGRVVAALGLYAPAFRFEGERKASAVRQLAQAAEEISRRLGEGESGPRYDTHKERN